MYVTFLAFVLPHPDTGDVFDDIHSQQVSLV